MTLSIQTTAAELQTVNGSTARLGLLTTAFFRADAIEDDWDRASKFRELINLLDRCQTHWETDASDKAAKDYDTIRESMFYGFQRATARVSTVLRSR